MVSVKFVEKMSLTIDPDAVRGLTRAGDSPASSRRSLMLERSIGIDRDRSRSRGIFIPFGGVSLGVVGLKGGSRSVGAASCGIGYTRP